MADTYKFPNGGYDVRVCKKQDIIDCIDENIVDKEIVLAIVEQCEVDAATFLNKGRWTGIPFIGNIRIPKTKLMEATPEQQALIQEAKDTLDNNQYIMFRKQLGNDNSKRAKQERYYKYVVSMAVSRNRKLYKRLCIEKGDVFARLFMYATYNVTAVDNEYEILNYDEQ
jgi:hypothetical protein